MSGPAQRRFCDKCDKHVHNLSEMTEREARALLERAEGASLCVRYRVRTDGNVRFRPQARRAGFVAALSLAMVACTSYAEPEALEGPDAALVCRDASGYAIDCELAELPTIPDAQVEPEPEPEPEVVPDPEPYELMGVVAFDPVPSEPVEPCPLPDRSGEGLGEEQGEVFMGDIAAEPKPSRREARRRRRQERRRSRATEGDRELMGVVEPYEG